MVSYKVKNTDKIYEENSKFEKNLNFLISPKTDTRVF